MTTSKKKLADKVEHASDLLSLTIAFLLAILEVAIILALLLGSMTLHTAILLAILNTLAGVWWTLTVRLPKANK
jgi:multidrug efflux pump subunit AcrB